MGCSAPSASRRPPGPARRPRILPSGLWKPYIPNDGSQGWVGVGGKEKSLCKLRQTDIGRSQRQVEAGRGGNAGGQQRQEGLAARPRLSVELGRASGRGRVCQYG